MKAHAYLFVDGSASADSEIGAWAALAVTASGTKLLYGINYPTTISRCELLPIIEGIRWIKQNWVKGPGFRLIVCSDSEYTIKTLSNVYGRHKNMDLWAAIDEVSKEIQIRYIWKERNVLYQMKLCDHVCGLLRKHTTNIIPKELVEVNTTELIIANNDLSNIFKEDEF